MAAAVEEVRALVRDLLGPVDVEELRRLSGGASSETWSFDAVTLEGERRPLVLRRPRHAALTGGTAPEAALLRAAAAAGVPVPEVVADRHGTLVLARVDGETIPRKILRDPEYASARAHLTEQCATALAAVHRIDVARVPGLVEQDALALWRRILDDIGHPHPAFELAFRWLEARRPPAARVAVVHGDFRNGNFVVGPDGLRAVLDWELAHLGDPMEDLGWLCAKAWRFGMAAPVGGFGERAELFAAYEAAGGAPVDPDAVRWWEVMGTLKWGVMCILQALSHLSGMQRSVELAAIGRRVCENEWDLLELVT